MKTILLWLCFLPCIAFAQGEAKSQNDSILYKNVLEGARLLDANKPDSARICLKKAVETMPKNAYAWYLLAAAEDELNNPQEALIDINIALELSSRAHYILTWRGLFYVDRFNYALAIEDFTEIINAKPTKDKTQTKEEAEKAANQKGMAYYYRALVYDYLCDYKKCKKDALAADKLGAIKTERQKKRLTYFQTDKRAANYHSLTYLSKQSKDPNYGFNEQKPIKVGNSMDGMANNEYTYMRRLRDAKGNPVKFERKGSCCAYPSKFALFGNFALLDHFEIEYEDATGKTVKRDLYISMYDYEDPLIPVGLNAVQPLK